MHESEALSRPFNILAEWGILDEGDTPQDVLMDFMVYGKSSSVFRKWYHEFDCNFNLTSRLAAILTEKGKASFGEHDLPDLMERCRYHRHYPDHCYLDK
jgi:hypothetical protein